jgi:hypothetical protein
MLKKTTDENQELFRILSDIEQEFFTAGQSFNFLSKADIFLQKTDIETTAENQLNLGINESNSQKTQYDLSQVTLGASFTFGLPRYDSSANNWLSFIPNILNRFFS